MPIIIREFQAADYEAVVRLWEAGSIRVDSLDDLTFKLQRDPELFLVAEDAAQLVGVVMGTFDGRFGSINRLAVAEPARRLGLATELVAAVEERLRAKCARRVWAWIHDDNQASRSLFARSGYEEWSDVVTVSKSLSA